MPKNDAATIDAYIAAQPAAARPALEKMRQVIGKAIPGADEAISYGMPAYRLGGRVVVYFAGWKQHTALYPGSAQTFAAFGQEVAGYATSKGTLQFPLGEPLPVKLIAAIAKHRAVEVATINKARSAAKRKAPAAKKKSPAARAKPKG
jgi:uncharacterized protein YdhG (YjbR/CyaY superfamily)